MKKKSIFIYVSLVLVILVIVYFKTDIIYNYTKPKKVDYNYGISDLTKQKALKFKEELIKDSNVFNYEDDFRNIALNEVSTMYDEIKNLESLYPKLKEKFNILKYEMTGLDKELNYDYIARICRGIKDYHSLNTDLELKDYYNSLMMTTNEYQNKVMHLNNRVTNIEKHFLNKDNFINVLALEYKLKNETEKLLRYESYEDAFDSGYRIEKIINITDIDTIDFLYLDFLDKEIQELENKSTITKISTGELSELSKVKYNEIKNAYDSFLKKSNYDNHLYLFFLETYLNLSKESRTLDFTLMEYYFLMYADFYAKEMDQFDEQTIRISRNELLINQLYDEYKTYKKELINSKNTQGLKDDFVQISKSIKNLLDDIIYNSKEWYIAETLDINLSQKYADLKVGRDCLKLYRSIFNL